MVGWTEDPLREITERVADCLAQTGYAFVEDDKVEALAVTLRAFLRTAGVPVREPDASDEAAGQQ